MNDLTNWRGIDKEEGQLKYFAITYLSNLTIASLNYRAEETSSWALCCTALGRHSESDFVVHRGDTACAGRKWYT